jgi:hypothetical protein
MRGVKHRQATASGHVVKISFVLPMSASHFVQDKQDKFKDALAAAVGVKPQDISIDRIEDMEAPMRAALRRLLDASVRVDVAIRV